MFRKFLNRTFSWVTAATLAFAPLLGGSAITPTAAAPAAAPQGGGPLANKVVFFASDGMRPDIMEQYAAQGYMPTYKALMDTGVKGDNGLLQAFPPNTGVGWATLATGAWPSEHGSTNNTFFRAGESNFNNRTSFADTGVLQADTIQQAAERAGKKIASVEWVASRSITPTLRGPVIDFRTFFSTRGVLAYPFDAAQQTGAAAFAVSYTVASFITATNWVNAPAGDDDVAPPMETDLFVLSTFTSQNPHRTYNLYIYDSIDDNTPAYDSVMMVRASLSKTVPANPTILGVNDWADIKLTGADGLIGTRAGQTAGFYTKLITLTANLDTFKIYFTSVTRANASCACNPNFESVLADMFPTSTAADFAPLEAGIVDEDTYVEQGLKWKDFHWAALEYILTVVQPDTDLLLLGNPVTDEFQHQFMALVTPTDIDGNPNPYYDDVQNDDILDNRVAIREGYLRSAYMEADETLAHGRAWMAYNNSGEFPTTFASSDHGFAPQWYAVNARQILSDTMVTLTSTPVSLHSSPAAIGISNCRAAATDLVKVCWAGGTAQFYINPATVTNTANINVVTNAVISAFQNLTDTINPTATVVSQIFTKAQLRNVDGTDALHPSRSGDVVVVLRPPYQYDAATPNTRIAFSQFFGQHGYLPNLVNIPRNVNMHATFVAAGPGITSTTAVVPLTSVSLTGPATGTPNTDYTFTADIGPASATIPASYIWRAQDQATVLHTDGLSNTVTFNWATPGAKTITVTVVNGGSATQTKTTTIYIAPQSVTIAGATTTLVQTSQTFTATIAPPDTSTPITYTWSPAPTSGQGTNEATYTFTSGGTHTLTVTAENAVGMVTDTHTIDVSLLTTYLPIVSKSPTSTVLAGPTSLNSPAVAGTFTGLKTASSGNGGITISNLRAIDVAPTLAYLMGIPGPQNASGQIRYDMTVGGNTMQEVTLLNMSDFHGQLTPLTENPDTLAATPLQTIGGAAYLKTWFDWYEAEAGPNGAIRLTGGDTVGATPPISAFFADTPTIEALNQMLFDYEGLGNHNFDRGADHLTATLIPSSTFGYLSANIVLTGTTNTPAYWSPSVVITLTTGARIGLVGFSNDDLPLLTSPTALGPFQVISSTAQTQAAVNALQSQNISTIIGFGHLGATAGTVTNPTGPLMDLANNVTGLDVVIGDHTNFQVLTTTVNNVLVTENLSTGRRFTRIRLTLDAGGNVVYKTADFHRPWNIGVPADPGLQAFITNLNAQLTPIFNTIIGNSGVPILRSDVCGRADGRLCESLVGNVTTDAMRQTYNVDFAITNAGGLRAALTCPSPDVGGDFCPPFTPTPYPISRGQVLTVLPFGNIVVTLQVNGVELKTMLENGFSTMPAANGRFPQVSGLCVSYDISSTVGTRVISATRQLNDGSCGGAAVDFTAGSTYSIAENDFMVSGGDGYPNFSARATSQNIMDQVLADHVTALSAPGGTGVFTPTIQGRIMCYASGIHNGGACPVGGP